jgi:hypothetical protein
VQEAAVVLGALSVAVRIPSIKGSLRPGKNLDGRAYVPASELSYTEPRLKGESGVLISDRYDMGPLLGERKEAVVGPMVRAGVKPTYRIRLCAWLLLRAAIRYRFGGRAEPVVALRPLVVLRHPDVARRMGLETGLPGLAAAERFLKRRSYVRPPVTADTEHKAFLITDAGRTWPSHDRWARSW